MSQCAFATLALAHSFCCYLSLFCTNRHLIHLPSDQQFICFLSPTKLQCLDCLDLTHFCCFSYFLCFRCFWLTLKFTTLEMLHSQARYSQTTVSVAFCKSSDDNGSWIVSANLPPRSVRVGHDFHVKGTKIPPSKLGWERRWGRTGGGGKS